MKLTLHDGSEWDVLRVLQWRLGADGRAELRLADVDADLAELCVAYFQSWSADVRAGRAPDYQRRGLARMLLGTTDYMPTGDDCELILLTAISADQLLIIGEQLTAAVANN